MSILAIDLGTQSIRAAIVDIDGTIKAISQIDQEIDTPQPGWAQQKPEIWWKMTKLAIQQVISLAKKEVSSIQGICTCGQMHGPVGIDTIGNITTEWTQIWMDKRCDSICDEFRKKYEENGLVKGVTANPINTGWSGVKIRWIKDNQPKIYNNSRWFLVPKDFINFKLTGIAATDPSEASGTFIYDSITDAYSEKMANIIGVDIEKFAPIHNSYDTIGYISNQISDELGLPPDLPVSAGGGDFIVSLLGLGLIDESTAVDMTGTSTLFIVHKEHPIIHPQVQNLRHVIKGWTPFTMLDCGGLSLQWYKDFLSLAAEKEITYDKMIKMAEQIPIGSDGLQFYPYFLGERRKENIFARGCFFGLKLNHNAAHFARSIMEGVALALGKDMDIFKKVGVKVERVYCVGGATRNKLLYQIKADIMQLPQIIKDQPEASLIGCGLLGAFGLHLIKDFNFHLQEDLTPKIIIKPNHSLMEQYYQMQKEFNKMYNHLLGFWVQ
ncbi:MAG: FGGY-family carbohydrate kinase [Candidatus Thorarchaeota archaeon]